MPLHMNTYGCAAYAHMLQYTLKMQCVCAYMCEHEHATCVHRNVHRCTRADIQHVYMPACMPVCAYTLIHKGRQAGETFVRGHIQGLLSLYCLLCKMTTAPGQ